MELLLVMVGVSVLGNLLDGARYLILKITLIVFLGGCSLHFPVLMDDSRYLVLMTTLLLFLGGCGLHCLILMDDARHLVLSIIQLLFYSSCGLLCILLVDDSLYMCLLLFKFECSALFTILKYGSGASEICLYAKDSPKIRLFTCAPYSTLLV